MISPLDAKKPEFEISVTRNSRVAVTKSRRETHLVLGVGGTPPSDLVICCWLFVKKYRQLITNNNNPKSYVLTFFYPDLGDGDRATLPPSNKGHLH